jgi:isopenicillin N synthase-like dioxygenase/tRNA(Arg) A34 adenosine deaminase TadA
MMLRASYFCCSLLMIHLLPSFNHRIFKTMSSRPYDDECLRAAIKLSDDAAKNGNMPFGAVLADPDGKIIVEAHNLSAAAVKRGGTGDVTRHAEMELVRRLCEEGVDLDLRPQCTLYTSTEPCVMCAGAIYWSQVGRVVFGASSEQLEVLSGPGGLDIPLEQVYKMGREGARKIEVVGPMLSDEAMKVHQESGCWPGCTSKSAKSDIETERLLFSSGLGAAEARSDRQVPVIDISKGTDEEIAEQLLSAANSVGFFTVIGHGIDQALIDQAFQASEDFFAQDQTEKEIQSPFARNLNSGYEYMSQVRPSAGTNDQKESMQITAREGSMYGRWPKTPSNFQGVAEELLSEGLKLSQRILNLLQEKACAHLEPGLIANSHKLWSEGGQCTLRLLHYPSMELDTLHELTKPDADGRIHWRAGPHTDWDNVTLLFQRPGQAGLECCSNPRDEGKEERFWSPVDPVQGGIAVNIGDMLARWSAGKLYSNLHRVRMPTEAECTTSRYSMAFFAQSDKSAVIESEKSETITAGDYILSRIQSNFAK